jgi:enoyl-CoA hydratase/carnithine racemase
MGTMATTPPATLEWPTDSIALIRLTRGETHNTITDELLSGLDALFDETARSNARALVIIGSGKTFCGGAHVKLFTDPASAFYHDARAIRDDYVKGIIAIFGKLRGMACPTIAAINGHALGGGCELALSCDFRLMSETARIGLTEVRLGALAGAGGVQSLTHVVGRARALEIALLGDMLGPEEAHAAGLVRSVHPASGLESAALDLARRFMLCSPISVAETKQAIYRCETAGADEANRIALDAVLAAAAGTQWWEGMQAFTERRQPSFRRDV